jgi:hypothetical protein
LYSSFPPSRIAPLCRLVFDFPTFQDPSAVRACIRVSRLPVTSI